MSVRLCVCLRVCKCVREREILLFRYHMPAESGGWRLLWPKDVLALEILKSALEVMRY